MCRHKAHCTRFSAVTEDAPGPEITDGNAELKTLDATVPRTER